MDTIPNYFAGFIDGEGTITIKRQKRYGRWYYVPLVSCAQVQKPLNEVPLKMLKKRYGGSIVRWTQRVQDGNRIDTVSWSVTSRNAMKFIDEVGPLLIIKKNQAKILRRFVSLTDKKKSYRVSDALQAKRESLFWEMRRWNVKGRVQLQRLSEETAKADATV